MVDELNPPETEIAALTRQLAERDHAFGELKTRLETAEATASTAAESAKKAAAGDIALIDATSKYQALLVQTNPDIPAEIIKGGTIAELEASLISGKAIVQHVKQTLEAQALAAPIPAGAPERTPVDLSSLTPHELIMEGIRHHDSRK